MRHHNSVFHELLKHVPWAEFDRLDDKHRADRRVRRLNGKSQFVAMLFGQLSGAASLREIVGGVKSQSARLYHLKRISEKRVRIRTRICVKTNR